MAVFGQNSRLGALLQLCCAAACGQLLPSSSCSAAKQACVPPPPPTTNSPVNRPRLPARSYVGGAPGKIDLYVGKEVVRRNIDNDKACDELIDLIKARIPGDRWQQCSRELQPLGNSPRQPPLHSLTPHTGAGARPLAGSPQGGGGRGGIGWRRRFVRVSAPLHSAQPLLPAATASRNPAPNCSAALLFLPFALLLSSATSRGYD